MNDTLSYLEEYLESGRFVPRALLLDCEEQLAADRRFLTGIATPAAERQVRRIATLELLVMMALIKYDNEKANLQKIVANAG